MDKETTISTKGLIPGVAYVRSAIISNEKLQEQVKVIRERAALDGVDITKIYTDPLNCKFDGVQALLGDVDQGLFKVVYVIKIDRLSRSLKQSMKIIHILGEHEITLRAVNDNFDSGNPTGMLLTNFIARLSEFYMDEQIGKRRKVNHVPDAKYPMTQAMIREQIESLSREYNVPLNSK